MRGPRTGTAQWQKGSSQNAPSSSSSPSGAALPSLEGQPAAADGGRGWGAGWGAGDSLPLDGGAAGRPPNRDARWARRATSSASSPAAAAALLRRRPFGGGGGGAPAAAAEPPPNLGMLASAAALAAARAASSICEQLDSSLHCEVLGARVERAQGGWQQRRELELPTLRTSSASASFVAGARDRPNVN